MNNRQHSLFDPAALGPDLEISQGGEVIAPSADSLSNERTARGTQPQTVGTWSVEFLAWGLDDPLSAVVGIVTADASLSGYVGSDGYGIGYDLASGDVLIAGAAVATITPAAKGDIISIQADLADEQLLIYVNGVLVHIEPLPVGMAGEPVYPAASMGSDIEADGRVFMNAGQRAFEFPLGDSDGWYSIPVTIDTVRFCDSANYYAKATDEIPHAMFHGCVAQSSFPNVRSLNFWTWGEGRSRGATAQFVINDPDGQYDYLLGANVRDLEVTVHEIPDLSSAFADALLVGTFVLERVDVINDGQKRITLQSRAAVLSQPSQTRLFLPNAPEEVANRPMPIRLGVVRSIEPILIEDGLGTSPPEPVYQVADSPMQAFGLLRDKGDPLAIGVDWNVLPGQQQIYLYENPEGKLTFDASSIGGESITNLVPTTVAGWDTVVNVTGTSTYTFGNAAQTTNGTIVSRLTEGSVLTAGKSYGFILVVDDMSVGVSQTGVPVRVSIGEGVTSGPNGPTLDSPVFSATSPGTYTGSFVATATGPVTLALRGVVTIINSAVVSRFEVFEAASTTQDTLQPITLEGFAREMLQTRGGLPESQWSSEDTAEIDTVTSYGLGFSAVDPISIADALQAALVGFGACYWQDATGRIRFTRIVDPADVTPVGTITQDVMLSDLAVTPDFAPGLTSQIAGQRNWTVLSDTDFVTDFDDVPISVRKILGRKFRAVRTTGSPFPSEYAHARGASSPLETLIDEPASLQREIDRVAALYQVVRFFYQIDIPIDALPAYELGQIWTLQYPRYGLDAGKPCLLVGITEDRVNRTATLRLWG